MRLSSWLCWMYLLCFVCFMCSVCLKGSSSWLCLICFMFLMCSVCLLCWSYLICWCVCYVGFFLCVCCCWFVLYVWCILCFDVFVAFRALRLMLSMNDLEGLVFGRICYFDDSFHKMGLILVIIFSREFFYWSCPILQVTYAILIFALSFYIHFQGVTRNFLLKRNMSYFGKCKQ